MSAAQISGIELAVGPVLGRDDPSRRLIVLICYLDDSYDAGFPVKSIGGYIGAYPDWIHFEQKAEPIFKKFGVNVLEGKKINATRGDFKNWKIKKKEDFVDRLQTVLRPAALYGIFYAIRTDEYDKAKADHKKNLNESAFGYAFRIVMDSIFRAAIVRKAHEKKGWRTQIILEQGNANNADAQRIYNQQLVHSQYGHLLGGFSEAPKDSSRALQMADLLAFYARRYSVECAKAGKFLPHPLIGRKVFNSGIPIQNLMVTGFHGPDYDLSTGLGFGWKPGRSDP